MISISRGRWVLIAASSALAGAAALSSCVGSDGTGADAGADSGTNVTDSGTNVTDSGAPTDAADAGMDGSTCVVPNTGAHGSLDTTFSNGTKTTITGAFRPRATAVDSTGAIYVVGLADSCGGAGSDYAIVRLAESGSIDPSFNPGGLPRCLDYAAFDYGLAAATLPSGAPLLGGGSGNGSTYGFGVVASVLSDGGANTALNLTGTRFIGGAGADASLPTTDAGTYGVVTSGFTMINGIAASATKIAIVGSNSIATASFEAAGTTGFVDVLNLDGTTDSAFTLYQDGTVSAFFGVAFDAAGNVIAVGQTTAAEGSQQLAVRRIHPDGITVDINANFSATGGFLGRSIAILENGNFIVAGPSNVLPSGGFDGPLTALRLTASGTADPAFNGGAPLVLPLASDGYLQHSSLALLCDGTLLVAGRYDDPDAASGDPQDIALVKVAPDGTVDNTFGEGGIGRDIIVGAEVPVGAAQDPTTGKVIVIGRDTTPNLVIARFNP